MRTGAVEEFSAFMAGRWSALVRFGCGLTGDAQAAEELTRAALTRTFARWSLVRRSHDPENHVRKVMLSRLRRPSRNTGAGRGKSAPDPATMIGALTLLPMRQRAVVTLRCWTGLSVPEIADALGWPTARVRRLDDRGTAVLTAWLATAGPADDDGDSADVAAGLRETLDRVTPSPAPVAIVVRQGLDLRRAWRLWVTGAITLIAVVTWASARPGAADARHHGSAPDRGRVGVVVGSGIVAGHSWRIVVDGGERVLCARVDGVARSCLDLSGYERLSGLATLSGAAVPLPGSEPGTGPPQWNWIFGVVRSDVTKVSLRLSDGETVALRPVSAAGERWIGYLYWPASAQVVVASAYAGAEDLGVVMPFIGSSATPGTYYLDWLHQRLPGPAEQERVIASGGHGKQAWSTSVLAGPWGYCVLQQLPSALGTREACWSVWILQGGARLLMSTASSAGAPRWLAGTARKPVAYLRLFLVGGGQIRVPVISVSGQRFYALRIGSQVRVARWVAYDKAGHRRSSGAGTPR